MTKIVQAEPLGWCAWVEVEFRGADAEIPVVRNHH